MKLPQYPPRHFFGSRIEKTVTHKMRRRSAGTKPAGWNFWRAHKLIGPAAAEKRALAVTRDVDVEHPRERARTALHPANVHASFSECIQQQVTKSVLAHAPQQSNFDPPGG